MPRFKPGTIVYLKMQVVANLQGARVLVQRPAVSENNPEPFYVHPTALRSMAMQKDIDHVLRDVRIGLKLILNDEPKYRNVIDKHTDDIDNLLGTTLI